MRVFGWLLDHDAMVKDAFKEVSAPCFFGDAWGWGGSWDFGFYARVFVGADRERGGTAGLLPDLPGALPLDPAKGFIPLESHLLPRFWGNVGVLGEGDGEAIAEILDLVFGVEVGGEGFPGGIIPTDVDAGVIGALDVALEAIADHQCPFPAGYGSVRFRRSSDPVWRSPPPGR